MTKVGVALLDRLEHLSQRGRNSSPARTSQLVARTRAGDTMAFDALVAEHREQLLQFVHTMLRDSEDAVEALQEAFVRAYRGINGYDTRKPFFPWLAGIACKCCHESLRRDGYRPTPWTSLRGSPEGPSVEGASVEDSVLDPRPGPEEEYESRETHDLVLDVVHRLPTRDRLIIILRCVNRYSFQEVGDLLGMTPEQVKKRLYVSRRWLEKQLRGILESRMWSEP